MALVERVFKRGFGGIISLLGGVWERVFRAAGDSVALRNLGRMALSALKMGSYSKAALKLNFLLVVELVHFKILPPLGEGEIKIWYLISVSKKKDDQCVLSFFFFYPLIVHLVPSFPFLSLLLPISLPDFCKLSSTLCTCPWTITERCKIDTSVDAFVAYAWTFVIFNPSFIHIIEGEGSIYVPLSTGTDESHK